MTLAAALAMGWPLWTAVPLASGFALLQVLGFVFRRRYSDLQRRHDFEHNPGVIAPFAVMLAVAVVVLLLFRGCGTTWPS